MSADQWIKLVQEGGAVLVQIITAMAALFAAIRVVDLKNKAEVADSKLNVIHTLTNSNLQAMKIEMEQYKTKIGQLQAMMVGLIDNKDQARPKAADLQLEPPPLSPAPPIDHAIFPPTPTKAPKGLFPDVSGPDPLIVNVPEPMPAVILLPEGQARPIPIVDRKDEDGKRD